MKNTEVDSCNQPIGLSYKNVLNRLEEFLLSIENIFEKFSVKDMAKALNYKPMSRFVRTKLIYCTTTFAICEQLYSFAAFDALDVAAALNSYFATLWNDPKGIRNLNPKSDPKINFHKSLKEKESILADSSIVLNSFIISSTSFKKIQDLHSDLSKVEMDSKNVLFQDENMYIQKLFDKISMH